MANYDVCSLEATGNNEVAQQRALLAERVEAEVAERFAREGITPTGDDIKLATQKEVNNILSHEQKKQETMNDRLKTRNDEMKAAAYRAVKSGNNVNFWDFATSRLAYMTGKIEAAIDGFTSAEGLGHQLEQEHLADISVLNDALNSSFLGSAITRNKGRDAELLQHYIDETVPKEKDLADALDAFRNIMKRKDRQYEFVYGSKKYRVNDSGKALPVVVNAERVKAMGKERFVDLMMNKAKVKYRTTRHIENMYDNIIREAESNDGFAVNGETELEFGNAAGYVELMNEMGVETLTAQLQTNINHFTRSLGIVDTVGDINKFVRNANKVALDNDIPFAPSVFGFTTGASALRGVADDLMGRLDNSIADWNIIHEESFNATDGTFNVSKMGKQKTIKLTPEEFKQVVENGKLVKGDPEKQKILDDIVAGRLGLLTIPGAQAGVMKSILTARPVIGAFRLGGAVFGLTSESFITGMAVSNISSYNSLKASLEKAGGTFTLDRKGRQDMAIAIGGLAMTLRQQIRPMMRGMVDGVEGPNARLQKLAITGSLEASGFAGLVSNAYHDSARAFMTSITHNVRKYDWDSMPEINRQQLSTYGIDADTFTALKKELAKRGDEIMKVDEFGGVDNGIINIKRAFADESNPYRRKVMAAIAQFQITTSGESTALSRSVISRAGLSGQAAPRGTLPRELPETMFQFLTFSMNTWGGIILPYWKAFLNAKDNRGQKMALMGMMFASGYAIYQAKNLIRDGEIEETNADNAVNHFMFALGYSSLGGLWTSTFLDPYADEVGPAAIASNPLTAALTDGISLATTTLDHAVSSTSDDYEKSFGEATGPKLNNFLRSTLPNTWWAQQPLDRYGYNYFRNLGSHQEVEGINQGL